MTERNIIGGVTASVLSPFIEGWQGVLEIKRKEFRNLINPKRHGKMPHN
jgi:hypothetical protein